MLILPKPAQDELAHGYWGRLSHINLFSDPDKAIRAFSRELSIEKHVSQKAFTLAAAASVTNGQFIRSHTLLPYVLAPRNQKPEECIGYKRGGRRGTPEPILALAREEAYFCTECAQIQKQTLGYTYWLRKHQLPGILWCPTHEIRLQSVSRQQLYAAPPHSGSSKSLASEICNAREQQTLRRFADISTGFLVREHASESDMGFYLLAHCLDETLLSDRIAQQFPEMWVAAALPAVQNKTIGKRIAAIDGYTALQNPLTLAVALTVFHKTAEDALTTWFG